MTPKPKVTLPYGWLSWAILAVVFLSSVLGGLAVSLTLQVREDGSAAKSPIQQLQLSQADLSLAVPLRKEASGWNMVQFVSYSCRACRESEVRLSKEVLEWAPNIGRMLLPLAPQAFSEGKWAERALSASWQTNPSRVPSVHRNLFVRDITGKKEAMEQRPMPDFNNPERMTEAQWEAWLLSPSVTDHLAKIEQLSKRIGVKVIPTYLLVSPEGDAWMVESLDAWRRLVKEHGPDPHGEPNSRTAQD